MSEIIICIHIVRTTDDIPTQHMDTHGFIEIVQNKNLDKSAKKVAQKTKNKKIKKENRQ